MLDHARLYAEPAMCDPYLPAAAADAAPLDDFQVFRKKWTNSYSYGEYYSALPYEAYAESELTNGVYQDLGMPDDRLREDWRAKYVGEWTVEDTLSWLFDTAQVCGIPELELPLTNFKVPGVALRGLRREHVAQMMEYPGVDPGASRRYAEAVFERLQSKLAEETAVPVSVLRYVDGDAYQPLGHTQVLNLDDYSAERRARLPPLDGPAAGHFSNAATCDSSDDADEAFRLTESVSPECSYGSDADTSKSGDELDKRRHVGKRPPGRPKGTGKKLSKRIKSVSVPEFLRDLLLDPTYCPYIIKWEDYTVGKFRFVKPDEVAKLWGSKKSNDKMSFEKFSRAMRYHYRQGVLASVPTARLVYQFGPKAPDYHTDNPNFTKVKTESDAINESSYS